MYSWFSCALTKSKEESHSKKTKLNAVAKAEQMKLQAAVKASAEETKELQDSVVVVK